MFIDEGLFVFEDLLAALFQRQEIVCLAGEHCLLLIFLFVLGDLSFHPLRQIFQRAPPLIGFIDALRQLLRAFGDQRRAFLQGERYVQGVHLDLGNVCQSGGVDVADDVLDGRVGIQSAVFRGQEK